MFRLFFFWSNIFAAVEQQQFFDNVLQAEAKWERACILLWSQWHNKNHYSIRFLFIAAVASHILGGWWQPGRERHAIWSLLVASVRICHKSARSNISELTLEDKHMPGNCQADGSPPSLSLCLSFAFFLSFFLSHTHSLFFSLYPSLSLSLSLWLYPVNSNLTVAPYPPSVGFKQLNTHTHTHTHTPSEMNWPSIK